MILDYITEGVAVDYLTWAILALVLFQPTLPRMEAAAVFAIMTFVHNTALADLVGFAYYGSDALFAAAIISLTAALPVVTRLTLDIHKVCLAVILLDFVGWLMWRLYVPPDAYNVTFILLYSWSIIILLKKEPTRDNGNNAVGGGCSSFYRSANPIHNFNHKH